jgi:oxygen-dependent protoporphyrinogen oxidase
VTYRPGAVRLASDLGLADQIIRPLEPRTVFIRTRGRLRRLPDGMGLALPTTLRPFLTTDLFTPLDKLRMALDLVLPRDRRTGDLGVGPFLERRLGRALVDRLAGPLIGGVYGTPIDDLSLDAVVPTLRASEREHRSLLLASLAEGRARVAAPVSNALEARSKPASPFVAMAGGTGELVEGLVAVLRAMPGMEIRTGASVIRVDAEAAGAFVRLRGGEAIRAEAVIVASQGPVTADLLAGLAPDAARAIRSIRHSTTTVVNLAYRAAQVPDSVVGHGFLVADDEPLGISAGTLTSRKWANRAPDGTLLARAFVRASPATTADGTAPGDDAALVALAHRDIAMILGIRGAPLLTRIARFPRVMPQYTVGHLERVAEAERALAAIPAIRLAGAAYRGAGLPDCIAQGEAAAVAVVGLFSGEPILR